MRTFWDNLNYYGFYEKLKIETSVLNYHFKSVYAPTFLKYLINKSRKKLELLN